MLSSICDELRWQKRGDRIKEVKKQYAIRQQQRQYERAIRQLKQAYTVYDEAGDVKMASAINKNITMAKSRLKEFCNKNNLKYYNWRTKL